MGGTMIDDDWELTATSNDHRTVVLVGRTGNGKSATGNSILGKRAFKSRASTDGVTSTSEMSTAIQRDGQVVNVIDTPGLFDFSEPEFVGREIVKCINLAKDGIHAVLLVLSIRTRFSKEEEAVIQSLQTLFGPRISDYMIVIFTNGDDLEENEETFSEYLSRASAEPLKQLLKICKNRVVLFDNKTKDEQTRAGQVQQLLSLVNLVMEENKGQPYTDEFFAELKEGAVKLHDQQEHVESLKGYSDHEVAEFKTQIYKSYQDQLKRITEMVETKLKETTMRLEHQLAEEHAARLKAEQFAQQAHMKSSDEIHQLRLSLQRAQKETEELREMAKSGRCAIL